VAGKYELIRLVAEGGMGSVYEARNTSTLKRCALKLLSSPELEQHPEIVQRFLLEARAASVLESEHIVQVFDAGIDNQTGRPYIIMEFLRGDDLKTTIERHGALEP
jgi:serine/threonine-protein kinase